MQDRSVADWPALGLVRAAYGDHSTHIALFATKLSAILPSQATVVYATPWRFLRQSASGHLSINCLLLLTTFLLSSYLLCPKLISDSC